MNHVPLIPRSAPTWRDSVAQDAPPRPRGRTGRTRLVLDTLRHWALGAACVALLIFGYGAWRAWRENPARLVTPAASAELREIIVRSDGVLDRVWVTQALALEPGLKLMELDLPVLRERLLLSGQVENAVVARHLPDVLTISLQERSPVLRVRARDGEGRDLLLHVARDGFVFTGANYDEALLANLPWLAGVRLMRETSGRGFARIDGMEAVSELLGTVRASAPGLARDFQVVSLERFAADGVIAVRMPGVAEVAFGNGGYYTQIARLDYILDQLRARGPGGPAVRSINLAVGGRQIPIAFEPLPAPTVGVRSAPSATRSRERAAAPSTPTPAPAPVFFRL